MAQAPLRPATEPFPWADAKPSTSPSLELSTNQLFRAVSRIAHPMPSWDSYEAASDRDRAAIERQWKNNWRSDEAQRLYRRAAARRRTDGNRTDRTLVFETPAAVRSPNSSTAPASVPTEFTRKLTFDEQNALHSLDPDKYWRYVDWLFARNAPMTKRWVLREFLHRRDVDRERGIATGDDYEVTPEQFGWSNR